MPAAPDEPKSRAGKTGEAKKASAVAPDTKQEPDPLQENEA